MEKRCEILFDWRITLEKGVFKSPSFFRDRQERRPPFIRGER